MAYRSSEQRGNRVESCREMSELLWESKRQQQRFGGRHGMRQPGMLGGLGLDDFYRYQAPLFRQRP